MNDNNLSRLHEQHLEPPTDYSEISAWDGQEIYHNQEYLEFENGDIVLLEKNAIMAYLEEKFESTLEMLDDIAIRKVVE